MQLRVHPPIILDEGLEILLHEGHAQDVDNLRALFVILNEQLIYQVFKFLRVHVRDRALLILHDLKDETQ